MLFCANKCPHALDLAVLNLSNQRTETTFKHCITITITFSETIQCETANCKDLEVILQNPFKYNIYSLKARLQKVPEMCKILNSSFNILCLSSPEAKFVVHREY